MSSVVGGYADAKPAVRLARLVDWFLLSGGSARWRGGMCIAQSQRIDKQQPGMLVGFKRG